MSEFNADFWIAAAAGAPVVALAAVVQSAEASKARDNLSRLFYELEADRPPGSPDPRKLYVEAVGNIAFAVRVELLNILVQAGLFTFSLIVLGQHRYNPPSKVIFGVAFAEGAGVIAILFGTLLTSVSSNNISSYFIWKDVKGKPRRKRWWEIDRGNG